jgi:hypothetical protein
MTQQQNDAGMMKYAIKVRVRVGIRVRVRVRIRVKKILTRAKKS